MNITKQFDNSGLSLNGKIQLEQDQAYHNCAGDESDYAYIQAMTLYVIEDDDGTHLCSKDDDYTNQVELTTRWEITNPEAEEEEDMCDWYEWEVTADDMWSAELTKLLTK